MKQIIFAELEAGHTFDVNSIENLLRHYLESQQIIETQKMRQLISAGKCTKSSKFALAFYNVIHCKTH